MICIVDCATCTINDLLSNVVTNPLTDSPNVKCSVLLHFFSMHSFAGSIYTTLHDVTLPSVSFINPGCLGDVYWGWETTQLCGDYNNPF